MLRRSDFIEARYAFSFVLANFGIAIAARMPMITTTIRSSISVKPLRRLLFMSGSVKEGSTAARRELRRPQVLRVGTCLGCWPGLMQRECHVGALWRNRPNPLRRSMLEQPRLVC